MPEKVPNSSQMGLNLSWQARVQCVNGRKPYRCRQHATTLEFQPIIDDTGCGVEGVWICPRCNWPYLHRKSVMIFLDFSDMSLQDRTALVWACRRLGILSPQELIQKYKKEERDKFTGKS